MNRHGLLSMAAMASMMAFTACDKPAQADDTDTTEPEGIEQTDMVEAYYVGDYYESGTGNGWINFINGDLVLDEETEEYTGNGMRGHQHGLAFVSGFRKPGGRYLYNLYRRDLSCQNVECQ